VRLILNIRGTNVIDLELHWPTPDEPADDGPTLHATGGGGFERAEPYGDPATQSGFGFTASKGDRA
jgi:hypothetical protein